MLSIKPQTSKNTKRIANIILSIAIFVFIGLFGYLSLFSHANTDDYFLGFHVRLYGFGGYQQHIYKHWGGRYFSNLMGAMFAKDQFIFQHYAFHTWLLLILTIAACFYLFRTINVRYLEKQVSFSLLFTAAIICSLATITCMPEPSTAFFWFSSSITYQLSFVFLLLGVALGINAFDIKNFKNGKLSWLLLLLDIVIVNGSNELAGLLLGSMLLLFILINWQRNKLFYTQVSLVAIVFIGSIAFSGLAPGNKERLQYLGESKNIIAIAVIAAVRLAYVFWSIFQSSFFWVVLLGCYCLAVQLNNNKDRAEKIPYPYLLLLLLAVLLLILIPILYISHGSLPERASNLLASFSVISLLAIAFYVGFHAESFALVAVMKYEKCIVFIKLTLAITLLSNATTKEMIKSAIAAKLFNAVMLEREAILSHHSNKTVMLDSYHSAIITNYQQLYGDSQSETIKQLILQKPNLLFVFDDLATPDSRLILKQYFEKESIVVKE